MVDDHRLALETRVALPHPRLSAVSDEARVVVVLDRIGQNVDSPRPVHERRHPVGLGLARAVRRRGQHGLHAARPRHARPVQGGLEIAARLDGAVAVDEGRPPAGVGVGRKRDRPRREIVGGPVRFGPAPPVLELDAAVEAHPEQAGQPPAHAAFQPVGADRAHDGRRLRRGLVPLAVIDGAVEGDARQPGLGRPFGRQRAGADLLPGVPGGGCRKAQAHALSGGQPDDLRAARGQIDLHRSALDPRAVAAVHPRQLDGRLPGQAHLPQLSGLRLEQQGDLGGARLAQPPVGRGGGEDLNVSVQLDGLERVLVFPEVRDRVDRGDRHLAGADACTALEAHVAVGVGEGGARRGDVERAPVVVAGQPHPRVPLEGDDRPAAVLDDVPPPRLQPAPGQPRQARRVAHGHAVALFAVIGLAGVRDKAVVAGHPHRAARRELVPAGRDERFRRGHGEALAVLPRGHGKRDLAEEADGPVRIGRLARGFEPEAHLLALAADELDAGALDDRLGIAPLDDARRRRVPSLAQAGDEEPREEDQPGGDGRARRRLPADAEAPPSPAARRRGGRRGGPGGGRRPGVGASGLFCGRSFGGHVAHCIDLTARRQ